MDPLSLAGCAINDERGLLLLHRDGRYEMPGGKRKEGEGAEEAAIREVREELGVDVEIMRWLGRDTFTEEGRPMVYDWYQARLRPGQRPAVKEPETFDHYRRIPLDELARHPLSANMQNFSAKLRAGEIRLAE